MLQLKTVSVRTAKDMLSIESKPFSSATWATFFEHCAEGSIYAHNNKNVSYEEVFGGFRISGWIHILFYSFNSE